MISWLIVLVSAIAISYSGYVVQTSWNNPLGDVYSLGLGSAVCAGGILSICFGVNPSYGALAIGLLFYVITLFVQKLPIQRLVTFGMVFGTAVGSITTITATNVSPEALQEYYLWSSTRIPTTLDAFSLIGCLLLFSIGLYLCRKFPGPASATLLTTSVIFITAPIWVIGITCPNLARLTSKHVVRWSLIYGVLILGVAYFITASCSWCYLPLSSVVSILTLPCYFYTVYRSVGSNNNSY